MKENIIFNSNSIKVFLTLMVIFIHAFTLVPTEEHTLFYSMKVYFSFVLPRTAVPMFFIYSGFFFFKGNSFNIEIYKDKIKKRVKTLFVPYVLWCAIASPFIYLTEHSIRKNGISFLDLLFRTFLVNSYESSKEYPPQWIGYEIPKITVINMPLWYIRDLIILILLSPLVYLFIKNKYVARGTLMILLVLYVLYDTDSIPFFGIDCFFYFFVGAFLSYYSINIKSEANHKMLIVLSLIASAVFFCYYWKNEGTMLRHIYIILSSMALLSLPVMKRCRFFVDKMKLEGGKMLFVYCSHIMILRLMVVVTYRLSSVLPIVFQILLYIVCPFICFYICVMIYNQLYRVCPEFLNVSIGNRIKH